MPCTPWQKFDQDYIRDRVAVNANGCWVWVHATDSNGYGSVTRNSGEVSSHRLSWKVFRGEVPFLDEVLHSCDNPPCCNPDHLFLGSKSDNTQDALKKGRMKCDPTKAAITKTIPQTIADDILRRVAAGENKKIIAAEYKIHVTSVYNIVNGKYNTLRSST